MESYERGALGLVRLIALGFIALGLLDAGLYLTQYLTPLIHQHHASGQPAAPLKVLRLLLDSIPLIIGIVILVKAKALAEWLSDLIQ
jgi:hypothetical protein